MQQIQFICSVVSRTKKKIKWLVKWQVLSVDEDGVVKVGALNLLSWGSVVIRNAMLSLAQEEVEKKLPVRRTGDLCWVVTDAEDKDLLRDAINAIAREWAGYSANISVQIF